MRPRRRDVMVEGGADLPNIPYVRSPRRGLETAAVGLVCLLGAATVGRIIAMGSYFTWDEAVYALTARSWLDGTPSTGWATHRPPGVSLLGVITLLVSHADAAFRLWGLAFGVLAIVGAWWLARGITGPIAGVLAAGVVAGIEPLLFNAGLYLTDVPATAMMLVLMGFLWRQFESEGPLSRTFLLAAPIAATAFYLRYGASLPIVWIGLTCAILWPRRLLAGWPTVLGAVGLLLVLLVPHFVLATAWTGVPWGIALGAQDLAAPAHPGDALGEYLADFPFRLAGGLAGVSMLVGLAGWAWFVADALIGRRHPGDARAMTFLALPALVTAGVLGFVALAQVRYILLPIALLTAMGPVALVLSVRHVPLAWHSAAGRGLVAAVAALLVLAAIANPWADVLATGARDARRQAEMPEVARQIVTMTDGQTCSVLTALVPNITWTTGCAAYGFGNPPQAGREAQLTGARRYLVLLAAADPRQPAGDLRADYLRLTDGPPVEVRNPRTGDVAVSIYRLR